MATALASSSWVEAISVRNRPPLPKVVSRWPFEL
jgi:hypothetical protein